jgi:hypothetical protein
MKLIIQKIRRYDTNPKGEKLINKNGKEYVRVHIRTDQYNGEVLGGFGNNENSKWVEGDEIKVNVEQNGKYLNFSTLKPTDLLTERVEKLEAEVKAIWDKIYEPKEELTETKEPPF